jgi:hypothetical protein
MKNISGYDDLQNLLSDVVVEYELDPVTVNSLLLSSFVFLEPELQSATVAIIDPSNFEKSKSIRASNIQVDLKFALDAIFATISVFTAKSSLLILYVLKAIVLLIDKASIQLGKNDAIVLFAIYRLQKADKNAILRYINKLRTENDDIDIVNESTIEKSLKTLEDIKTIELIDGLYSLNDVIVIKAS